jgi:hypothetical protein
MTKPPRRDLRKIHGIAPSGICAGGHDPAGPLRWKGCSMAEKKYRKSARDELNHPDYSFIRRDLRRILLIAGSFVAVMVVLAFILR